MADLSKTVSNSLRVSGPSPTNKWGAFNWGGNWGEGGDVIVGVGKWLADTVTITSTIRAEFRKLVTNTLRVVSTVDLVSLTDAAGYTYILQGGATDPSNRYFPSYSADTASSVTYTADTRANTSWGNA